MNTAPAFFDVKKLTAFNGEYIRTLSPEQFAAACAPWLVAPYAPWRPEAFDKDVFEAAASLAQTRLALLSEITSYVDFLFLDEPVEDEVSWNKAMKAGPVGRPRRAGRRRGLEGGRPEGRPARRRREARAEAGQGPGAPSGRGHRPDDRTPAVRVHGTAWPGPRVGPSRRRQQEAGRSGLAAGQATCARRLPQPHRTQAVAMRDPRPRRLLGRCVHGFRLSART